MLTEAQIQYLEDVLGTSAQSYRFQGTAAPHAASSATPVSAVQVFTATLSPEENDLLAKILASVKLQDVPCHQSLEVPADVRFALVFSSARPAGREGGLWNFPALADMLGQSPEVAAKKKQTWALLQQLAKELSTT